MKRSPAASVISSQNLINLRGWIHLPQIHTSAICIPTENPTQLIQQTLPMLKSPLDFNLMRQTICQMITNNIPIDSFSIMKFINISLSSSVPDYCTLLFTQFQEFLDIDFFNLIIKTYTHSNKHLHSVLVYALIHNHGFLLDCSFFPAVLKSAAQLSYLEIGKSIHRLIIQMGFHSDIFTNTALVHLYSTCKSVSEARQLFDEMPARNSVSWNAMITGYAHNRRFREALSMFRDMQILGVEPSEVTMVTALSACAHLGALNQGKWIHYHINQNNFRVNVFVGTALVDMYAKCGVVNESEKVFREMRVKNIYTWNALVSGFAMNGEAKAALRVFSAMLGQNVKPDGVTFLAVLCACCHHGLVDEGRELFVIMEKEYGLKPSIEHYGCMVDLLGRAGYLEEALELIRTMPVKADTIVWRALLFACRIHKDPNLGELAVQKLLELEPDNADNYILASNLYSRDQRWGKVEEMREMINSRGIQKVPGCSLIEIDNVVYEFVVAKLSKKGAHDEIYHKLADMSRDLRLAGYVADTEMVTYDVEEEEKEDLLMYHSEKLALAFGLLRTSPGSVITIVKNLRVCRDCHHFFKLVSKFYGLDITVRDRNRFHHFGGGICSCRDYW